MQCVVKVNYFSKPEKRNAKKSNRLDSVPAEARETNADANPTCLMARLVKRA